MTFTIDIRTRRQATFPEELLRVMGVTVGDQLEVTVKDKQAVIKPKNRLPWKP